MRVPLTPRFPFFLSRIKRARNANVRGNDVSAIHNYPIKSIDRPLTSRTIEVKPDDARYPLVTGGLVDTHPR